MPLRSWDIVGRAVLGALDAGARARMRGFGRRLGDPATIDLRQAIVDQANAQGVPPAIALAVAMRESGIQQWTAAGNLVVSSAGAIGIMQLMPATAAQLGVDPTDPLQNIQGGVTYLAQMYQQFGSWPLALAAYNWGPDKLQRSLQNGTSIPAGVQSYVAAVMSAAGVGAVTAAVASPSYGAQAPSPAFSPQINDDAGDVDLSIPPGTISSNGPLIVAAMAVTMLGVKWLLE
jgi:hypothetical protein